MKNTQLLSVVFSLIMFTGVTAGNAVYAQTDDLDDILEGFCDLTLDEQEDLIIEYDLEDYQVDLEIACEIEDENERDDALEEVIDEITFEIEDETDEEEIEDFEDCVEAGGQIGDNPNECTIDDMIFVNDEDDDNDDVIDSFEDCVEAGYPVMESYPEQCMTDDGTVFVNDEDDDETHDELEDRHDDLEDRLEDYCEMTDEEKQQFFEDHPRVAEFEDRLESYCELSDDEREEAIDKLIATHFPGVDDSDKVLVCHKEMKTLSIGADALRAHLSHGDYEGHCDSDWASVDAMHDKYSNQGKGNLHDRFAMYCDMTPEEREEKIAAMHDDLPDDFRADLARYCEMTDEEQDEFRDRIMDHMDAMYTDKKFVEYDRFCKLTDEELAASTFDAEFVKKASKWCDMTPEERKEFKKEHRDDKRDKLDDRLEKFDKKMEKFAEKSMRLKAMIEGNTDISDERKAELVEKFEKKQGEIDEKISELKSKFQKHVAKMHFKMMSDERKSEIHDRLVEMKAFKKELRDRDSDLSDEEKQQLRADFIEKAKDMQLAWINPRTQIAAGVDPVDVECREGFSLVMKESNGVAMCIKADTALKLIDRGIVVPAN